MSDIVERLHGWARDIQIGAPVFGADLDIKEGCGTITALRAENARLRGALESFVSADATDAKRMRLAIVDARARLAKGRGLWNGPCHECDEVLRRALTVNNYPAALAEKGK